MFRKLARAKRTGLLISSVIVSMIAFQAGNIHAQSLEQAISGHVDQADIESDRWTLEQLIEAGRRLFVAQFTVEDGLGRPGATGNTVPTRRPLGTAPSLLRTAGPDATACSSCHIHPTIGGSGDFVANVFVGAEAREPVISTISPDFSSERGTPEIQGAGIIELLAREMTQDLHYLRDSVVVLAKESGQAQRVELVTKDVSFGWLTALPDGRLRVNEVEGIDPDLVVRPWNQKGAVTSLRTFTVNAMNQHHGMQAMERFGIALTGTTDFDRDGVDIELTEGDITALVLFQATLSIPAQQLPASAPERERVLHGEGLFTQVGCDSCHRTTLRLNSAVFEEPGPFNLEGTLRSHEVSKTFRVNLAADPDQMDLERHPEGGFIIRAFTDLKRHSVCDESRPHFCNESLVQGFADTDEFLTRRLWAVGSTGPYGHRGDLSTIREAILHHGGEATSSRKAFERLEPSDQDNLILFLRSLRIQTEDRNRPLEENKSVGLPYALKQD